LGKGKEGLPVALVVMADALLTELDRIVGPGARTRFIEEAVVERLLLRAPADELRAHDSGDRTEAPTGEDDALARCRPAA
jgi:hypothetical protein